MDAVKSAVCMVRERERESEKGEGERRRRKGEDGPAVDAVRVAACSI